MSDVEELKSRARRAESAGEYRLALESYGQAVERERETTDPDLRDPALRLRLADLHYRLGEAEEALDAYLEASELYARQGLVPNAIAVCNKLLGVYPEHLETHRLLAELQLEIGLVADARNSLLRYLEEAAGRGRAAEAREAGRAFLEREPDQDVAIALAELLADEGRTDRAVEILRMVWEERTGLRQPAGRIEAFVRELHPGADLGEWTPVWPPPRREEAEAVTATAEALEERSADEAEGRPPEPEGPSGSRPVAPWEARPTVRTGGDGAGEEMEPAGAPDGGAAAPSRHNGGRTREVEPPPAADLGGEGFPDAGPDADRESGAGKGPVPRRVPIEEAPSTGEREAELRRGLALVEELLEVAPGQLDLHRRRVLYARRLGDLRLLERALVELGRVLVEQGSHRGARFVFEEVRDRLNPGSAAAYEGLRRLDRREEAPGDRIPTDEDASADGPGGREEDVDRHFRRRLREALSSSPRELAWLHAAAESCRAGGSGPVSGPSHELLGRYLLMRGRPEEATEHLRAALDRAPARGERPAELLYHLGRAWRRAEEPDRARACFEQLAEVDPDFRAAWDVVTPDET